MNNKDLIPEYLDKAMSFLYELIMSVSSFIVKCVTSPPKMLKTRLIEFKNSITRLFQFSISFKIATLSTFKIFRKLIVLNILMCLLFCGYNLYEIDKDFKKNKSYIVEYFKDIEITDNSIKPLRTQYKFSNIDLLIFCNSKKVMDTTLSSTVYPGIPTENSSSSYGDFLVTGKVYAIDPLKTYFALNFTSRNYMLQYSSFSLNGDSFELYFIKNLEFLRLYIFASFIVLGILSFLFLLSCSRYISKISKKMLVPVYVMNDAIKDINVSNLDTRLNVQGSKDELKDLAITVNNMFDRIQESYDKQKQFVSDASHELRTPISVIQGYVGLLDRWGKNDKEVLDESITAIKDESESMKELIEKLLFLARADKNTQKFERKEFNLSTLIDNICKEFNMIDASHTITSNTEDNLIVYADEKLLKQALRILIDNGIKYTPKDGFINISAFSSGNEILIRVADSGVGIPEEDLPHIFDRFYRVDESRTKNENTGGTGLGLSIAKWIASVHDGDILVESMISKGSVFTIKIPFRS